MELNFKKTALAIAALGLSTSAFAASYTPEPAPACVPGHVTTPCERTAWDIGFDAMWLEATGSVNFLPSDQSVANTVTFRQVDPDYKFGFRLEGSYHFWTGNDVTVNWLWYDDDATATQSDNGGYSFVNNDFATVKVKNDYDYNHVNVEFGQQIDVSDHVGMRFHMGGQYVNLENKVTTDFSNKTDAVIDSAAVSHNRVRSDFDGVGPRVGADINWHLAEGFSLIGRAAVGIVVGDQKSDGVINSFTSPNNTNANVTGTSVVVNKRRVVLPTLDSRLALRYTHAMDQGDLGIELGWHFESVTDGLANISANSATGAPVFSRTNFGIHGPYIGVKWVGDVAV